MNFAALKVVVMI